LEILSISGNSFWYAKGEEIMKTWNNFNSDVEFGEEFLPGQRISEATANDYWQRFAKSGSISDYLNYTAHSRGESKQDNRTY
jgi:hypothetical protein